MVSVTCETVEIQEGRLEPKELHDTEVFLEGKDLYVGPGSQWKIKGKDIVRMEVESDADLFIETKKNVKFLFVHQKRPPNDQSRKWESLVGKLQSIFERNTSNEVQGFSRFIENSSKQSLRKHSPVRHINKHQSSNVVAFSGSSAVPPSSRRRQGKFGTRGRDVTGVPSLSAKKSHEMPFRAVFPAMESAPKRKSFFPQEPVFSDDEEMENSPQLGEDASDDVELHPSDQSAEDATFEEVENKPLNSSPSPIRRTKKRVLKMGSRRFVDDDSDDDAMFNSPKDPPLDDRVMKEVTNQPNDDQHRIRQKMIRVQKMQWQSSNGDDSEDDHLLNSPKLDVTTPANQRVVQPNVVTDTHSTARSKINDKAVETGHTHETVGEKRIQPSITSFFSLQGKAASSLLALPTTPAKKSSHASHSPNSALVSGARITTIATSAKKKQRQHLDDTSWLQTSPARTVRSPQEKRRMELFGANPELSSTTLRKKTNDLDVLKNDPIEEFSSPPRKLVKMNLVRSGDIKLQNPPRRRIVPTVVNRFAKSSDSISSCSLSAVASEIPNQTTLLNTADLSGAGHSEISTMPLYRKFRGLRNLGNTCYQNATLQLLYTCFDMMSVLQKHGSKGPLTSSVCDIFQDLNRNFLPPVNSQMIKDAMDAKTDKYEGYEQRDAHEFLSDLIDLINDELDDERKKLPENAETKPLPTDDFCMELQVCLKCCSCGYTRTKEEMYRHLSIDIVNEADDTTSDVSDEAPKVVSMATVETSLAHFFQPETREIKCEKCEDGTHAQQTLRILSPPKLLVLHLKRFIVVERVISPATSEIDVENHPPNSPAATTTTPAQVEYIFKKNKAPISIPSSLSLNSYDASDDRQEFGDVNPQGSNCAANSNAQISNFFQETTTNYELQSIVHHIGSRASSGHYTADAVRPDCIAMNDRTESSTPTKIWVSFDDGLSTETSLEKIVDNPFKRSTAYMLLYNLKQ